MAMGMATANANAHISKQTYRPNDTHESSTIGNAQIKSNARPIAARPVVSERPRDEKPRQESGKRLYETIDW